MPFQVRAAASTQQRQAVKLWLGRSKEQNVRLNATGGLGAQLCGNPRLVKAPTATDEGVGAGDIVFVLGSLFPAACFELFSCGR